MKTKYEFRLLKRKKLPKQRIIKQSICWAIGALLVPAMPLQATPGELINGAASSVSSQQHNASGNEQVENTGAMGYSFPLGNELTASYSSQTGWSIGSTSQISRSTRYGVPAYDANDIFVLDGQELVCATNCNQIGTTRIYHQVRENYSRIEFVSAGTANSYWKVTTKTGQISRYGYSNDSRIDAIGRSSNSPRVWVISDSKNTTNTNLTSYRYTNQQGQYYLQWVSRGKASAGSSGFQCTGFDYEWLPTANRKVDYREGAKVKTEFYVQNVFNMIGCDQTGSGGTVLNRYHLSWSSAPFTSARRLNSITPHGTNDASLNPVTFEYFDLQPETGDMYGPITNWLNPEGDLGKTDAIQEYSNSRTKSELIDMNDDGLPDRVRKDSDENFRIWLNTGSGFEDTSLNWGNPESDAIREGNNTKADLIDMNGDGLVDRVRKNDGDYFTVRRNNGNGFNSPDNCVWGNPEGYFYENHDIRVSVNGQWTHGNDPWGTIIDLVDMNGDGFPDRVYKGVNFNAGGYNYDNQHFKVWLNTGCGFDRNAVQDWGSPENNLNGEPGNLRHTGSKDKTILELMDINGDGLPDRIMKKPGQPLYVWFNNGRGFTTNATTWMNSQDGYALRHSIKSGETNYTFRDLVDINGDGLPDRITKKVNHPVSGQAQLLVQMNTGTGFSSQTVNWGNTENQYLRRVTSNESTHGLIDLNGDKMLDRVIKCGSSCGQYVFSVRLNRAKPSELLLKRVSNSLGGKTSYEYQPLPIGPASGNPNYKSKKWVVSKKITNDGVGNSGRPISDRTTQYHYYNGFYNRGQREDYGIGKFVEVSPTGDVKETYFYRSFFALGKKQKEVLRQASPTGLIHSHKTYIYTDASNKNGDYSHAIFQNRNTTGPSLRVYAPQLNETNNFIVSGSTNVDLGLRPKISGLGYKRLRQTFNYDNYGNLLTHIDFGVVDPVYANDIGIDKITSTTLWAISLNNWIMKPRYQHTNQWKESNYQTSSKKYFYYDNQANGAIGSKGQLTKQRTYQSSGSYFDQIFQYDFYGNLSRERDGRGHWTDYTYDNQYHAYLKTKTQEHNLNKVFKTTHGYDSYMRLIWVNDPNNVKTYYRYDVFGRKAKEIKYGDSDSYPTLQYIYANYSHPSSPSYIQIKQKENSSNGYIISRTYFDGFGNPIQEKKETQLAHNNTSLRYLTTDNWAYVNGAKSIKYVSIPYHTTNINFSRSNTPNRKKSETQTYLDARPNVSNEALGNITLLIDAANTKHYTRQYHFNKSVLDSENRVAKERGEPQNLRRFFEQYNGKYPAESLYSTSQLQERALFRKIIDAKGNISKVHYDFLGRKIKMEDMDRGTWYYSYDNNGNLKTQKNALAKTISFFYDKLNRLITKSYPNGQKIQYYYDGDDNRNGVVDSGRAGLIGQMSYVVDLSGNTKFWFDKRYRKIREQKKIHAAPIKNTYFSYDSMGRMTAIKYPGDGNYTRITFDRSGAPFSIKDTAGYDIVKSTAFNSRGELSGLFLNASSQHYHYWGSSRDYRLRRIFSTKTSTNQQLIKYEFDYDKVGNILSINGYLNNQLNNKYSRKFVYDAQHRLKSQTNSAYYGGPESFSYNSIGNLTSRNGVIYIYPSNGSSRPHAVIKVGNSTYQYNNNGNAVRLANTIVNYNYDGMPSKIDSETYLYDYKGSRVRKTRSGTHTFYFNPYFEMRGSSGYKYFYHMGKRIAHKKIGGGYFWYHNDHLQGTSIMTNSSGNKTREILYNSFGVPVRNTGSGSNPPHKFTGKERDNSGLYFYGARYYHPTLGRFIQADTVYDPAAGIQGLNRYSYAANNPIRFNDPSGHGAIESWVKKASSSQKINNESDQIKKGLGVTSMVTGVAAELTSAAHAADVSELEQLQSAARYGKKQRKRKQISRTVYDDLVDDANNQAAKTTRSGKVAKAYGNAATAAGYAADAYDVYQIANANTSQEQIAMGVSFVTDKVLDKAGVVGTGVVAGEYIANNISAAYGENAGSFGDLIGKGSVVLATEGGYDMVATELQNSNSGVAVIDNTRHALGDGMKAWQGIGNQISSLWNSW